MKDDLLDFGWRDSFREEESKSTSTVHKSSLSMELPDGEGIFTPARKTYTEMVFTNKWEENFHDLKVGIPK